MHQLLVGFEKFLQTNTAVLVSLRKELAVEAFFERLPAWVRWALVLPGALLGYVVGLLLIVVLNLFVSPDLRIGIYSVGATVAAGNAVGFAAWVAPHAKRVTAITVAVLVVVLAVLAVAATYGASASYHDYRLIAWLVAVFSIIGAVHRRDI